MDAPATTSPLEVRGYDHATDYDRINDFLIDVYMPGERMAAWLAPRWEYMHFHEYIQSVDRTKIGVAEEGGKIIGVVHPEHSMAFGYLQLRPGRQDAAALLLDHAGLHLGGMSQTFGKRMLGVYVSDFDIAVGSLLERRGFQRAPGHDEEQSRFVAAQPITVPGVPDGFSVRSLEEDNDYSKIDRVLWRGFNHEGLPPADGAESRKRAQQAPNFAKDLTIVVVAPDGEYAAFAGMWLVPQNRVAYVEPVATDPAYRRMGLGSAAVVESMRRAVAMGAEVIWVGSDQAFYHSLGFETTCRNMLWTRDL